MRVRDDRTKEQKKTHTWLVVGTDKFLSGWGKASDGLSYAAWACKPEDRARVLTWVENRTDMLRVREVSTRYWRYNPSATGECHIYLVDENHPALAKAA